MTNLAADNVSSTIPPNYLSTTTFLIAAFLTAPPKSITETNRRGKKAKAMIANTGALIKAIIIPLRTAHTEYMILENFSPMDC